MKIYNYDKTTKEYLFESEASLDPQATKNQGKEVYLIPDCATVKKPPSVQKNEICIFLNGWQIKSDFRGQYIVNSDMIPEIVEEIGNIKEGYIIITDEQAHKIQEDDLFYIISNNTLIENPDYEQQARDREQERINGLTMTAQDLLDLISNSGASWDEIDNFLNSNKEFKLRLTTCQNVFCGVIRRLLPIKIGNLTITDEMIVMAFKRKNGEELPSEVENV